MAKGIYEKLLRLMEAVDHIEKRGKNRAQNYDYLMAEDVINEVRRECIKEKLVIIPAATGQNVITSENKSGGTMFLTTVPMTFTICDVETGETVVVPWQGQGQDSGDKGIYKAFTGADKYFLRNLLLIPTGDDPENDGTPAKPRTQPQRQQATNTTSTPPPTPKSNTPTNGFSDSELMSLASMAGYDLLGELKKKQKRLPDLSEEERVKLATWLNEKTVGEQQVKSLWMVARPNGYSDDDVHALLKERYDISSTKEIKVAWYKDCLTAFGKKNGDAA